MFHEYNFNACLMNLTPDHDSIMPFLHLDLVRHLESELKQDVHALCPHAAENHQERIMHRRRYQTTQDLIERRTENMNDVYSENHEVLFSECSVAGTNFS